MACQEEFLVAPDGCRLLMRQWSPEAHAAAVLILVHGFIEHSGRYAETAEQCGRHGLAVFAIDLRGHGKSEGDRALVWSFDQYLADLELLWQCASQRQPGRPVFLFGHSLGGVLALLFALARQEDLRGLIISGAPVHLGARAFPVLRHLAIPAGRFFPRLRLVRLGSGMLSRDPEVVADFRRDPLVFHGRFPLRSGAEILRAGRQCQVRIGELRLPLLLLHGTGDVVSDPQSSQELYRCAGSADKTLKLYDGLYHDLLHEPEKGAVLADVTRWIAHRTK